MPTLIKSFLTFLVLTVFAQAQAEQKIITQIDSTNYVTGETGYIAFGFLDRDLNTPPPKIVSPGLNIQSHNFYGTVINRRRVFIYVYRFSAVREGSFTIPSVSFEHYGEQLESDRVTINVIDREKLKLDQQDVNGRPFIYYTHLFAPKNDLFPGETAELEFKVYLPEGTRTLQWGVPTPENLTNCTAWRFSTPNNNASDLGKAILGGRDFQVASFKSVFSGIAAGKASIGPIETRIIAGVTVTDPRRGMFAARADLNIKHPNVDLNIQPYPTTPPPNFNGAVGNFLMEATTTTKTELKETDTIRSTITIAGKGNLPSLDPPTLTNRDQWVLIDSSRTEQGEERKSISGKAEFNFILRPKPNATTTPEFKFIYFNPSSAEFTTLSTPKSPISVEAIASNIATTAPDKPTETLTDILGPIPDISTTPKKSILAAIPTWTLHTLPAAILAWLIGSTIFAKLRTKKLQNSESTFRQQALKKLETNDENFLKSAAAYIQRWLKNNDDPALQQILKERDAECYLPDHQNKTTPSRKKEILSTLKKFSLILITLFTILPNAAEAGDTAESAYKAWSEGDYSKALELYNKAAEITPNSPDLLYNIGNCYYRLKEPGKAALYYTRALDLQENHPEALKNLHFIQLKEASITQPELEGKEAWIAKLNPEHYLKVIIITFWITLICALILYLKKPRTWKLAVSLTLLFLAPIVLGLGIYAHYNHPDKVLSDETADGIILFSTNVLTEPISPLPDETTNKTVIKATPGSPCRIIATRGSFTYIQLPNDSRGWVPSKKVAHVATDS